jgi:DNA polymerase-3 subunit delta
MAAAAGGRASRGGGARRGPAGSAPQGRGKAKAKLDAAAVSALLDSAASSTAPVCVVLGPEDALARLVIARLLARAAAAGATVVRVGAGDPGAAGTVRNACEPSLFGGATWLVADGLELGGEDFVAALRDAVPWAGQDLRLIVRHDGGARGRGVVNTAEQAGAEVFAVRPLVPTALPAVLAEHARDAGGVLGRDAADRLLAALGPDLDALLAAVGQLVADAPDGRISGELVVQTILAAAPENQFAIADLVWHRRPGPALEAFRRLVAANGAGSACVTVVAAMSFSLRQLVPVVAARPAGGSSWQLAGQLGVPAWKLDTLLAQAKLWRPGELAVAAERLARADAAAKGGLGEAGALDPEQKVYDVERLILQIADPR